MKTFTRRNFMAYVGTFSAVSATPAWAAPFIRTRIGDAPILMERDFIKVGYGQLHYRYARPLDPKDIKHRPVVCFHQTPISSQIYVEFMSELAQDRVVYAVDTPGQGQSDLPSAPPQISDYAQAMHEFLEAKSLNEVDLVGYHTGASIAIELALRTSASIQRMMLVGIALFNAEEREQFFANPWPRPQEKDGSHVLDEWKRSQFWRGPGQTDESVSRTFIEKISMGDNSWWGAGAVMQHDLAGALKKLKTPFIAVNAKDDLYTITPRLDNIRPDIKMITFDDVGFGIFEVQPKKMAVMAQQFFDTSDS